MTEKETRPGEVTKSASESTPDTPGELYLREYVESLKTEIRERAERIAKEREGKRNATPQARDMAQACVEIAPGYPREQSFWQRIASSITGITLISAALAIIFGVLGLSGQGNSQAWLDIAQIFAGAVVGSTGASVAASR